MTTRDALSDNETIDAATRILCLLLERAGGKALFTAQEAKAIIVSSVLNITVDDDGTITVELSSPTERSS